MSKITEPLRWMRPHWWVAGGELLMGLAMMARLEAGAPYALLGKEISYFFVAWFLVGSVLVFRSNTLPHYTVRTLAYFVGIVPFMGYSICVFYLFVFVRKLGTSSTSLTTPLAYMGVMVLATINYLLVAQLDFLSEHGEPNAE